MEQELDFHKVLVVTEVGLFCNWLNNKVHDIFWPRSSFAIAVLGVTLARLGKSRLTGQIVGWTNLNRLSTHMQGLGASSWWTSGGTLLIYFWIVLSQFCMPTIRWCYFGVEQFTEIKTRNFFCKVEISWFWFELKSLHCEFIIFWIAVLDLKSIFSLVYFLLNDEKY